MGVQIHVFQSKVGKNGKHIGENGWYDPKDNSIHIDLHAGQNGEGTILFTLAHELTHHIRKWSPAKFKILADFLVEEYGRQGVNVDGLVREQINKAKRSDRTISYDTAYEEMVADSMEMMLSDGNVIKKLAKLKARDQGLWQKIKDFINELATKIRNVYKGLKPDSVEGRYVADMGKTVYKLQELFAEALVDAGENYQSAEVEKNTTEGGVMYMSRDIADVTEDTVREDLTDVFNGNNVTSRSYIPLAKTTPFAVRYITGYMADRPIIVDKKKAYFDMREDGKFKEDKNHHYHGMGIDGFLDALAILNDPEFAIQEDMGDGQYHYAFISLNENGEELCVVFQMNVTKSVGQMNGYPGGYYNLDITEFVATDEWLEEHGVEPGTSYKDYLLSFPGNSIAYDRSIHLEQLEKARTIDSESAGLAASYDNNRASGDIVPQTGPTVKNESTEAVDVEVDTKTESVAPSLLFSERTWTEAEIAGEQVAQADRDLEAEIKLSDRDSDGFEEYDIISAVYTIRSEKASRGKDLVRVGTMPRLYRELFGLSGDVYVSNEHLYQNMVSKATAEAEGRCKLDASADYHNLGEEKIINAIEQFQDPLAIMESLKDFSEPRLVVVLDEMGADGGNLIAVLELYVQKPAHRVPKDRNHVLITIYEIITTSELVVCSDPRRVNSC